jgi:LysR family transcriptional regulator, nod-box dependent transcriptional activator
MRLDRFDLNLLVALDALLDECNVTRAAERLSIGQSAASGALARLREFFDDELLMPVGRELQLTPVARRLRQPVRDALLRVRAAVALRPQFSPATAVQEFVVCTSDYVSWVLLAEVIQVVAERAPGLTVHLQGLPVDLFDRFERGAVDLLVMPERYLDRLDHPRQRLFSDRHVCIAWTGNTRIGDTLSAEQYAELGHVGLRFQLPGNAAFDRWLFPERLERRRIEATVHNFSLVPRLVVGTQRIAVVQQRLGEWAARLMPLRLLEMPMELPPLVETMCWPRYADEDPAHRWLRETITEVAATSLRDQ